MEAGDYDFAALRTLYAADPNFKGRSQLSDRAIEGLIASQTGTPARVWTEDDVSRAILADFPLLETHHAAHEYFKVSQVPNAAKMVASHKVFYRSILDAILATRRDGPEGPVFSVLTIREEYAVMAALKRERKNQALVMIDGVPHDRLDSDEGPVFFDISAFFGKK